MSDTLIVDKKVVETYKNHSEHIIARTDCSACYGNTPPEPEFECNFCYDTGEIGCYESDSEGNLADTGFQTCECKL